MPLQTLLRSSSRLQSGANLAVWRWGAPSPEGGAISKGWGSFKRFTGAGESKQGEMSLVPQLIDGGFDNVTGIACGPYMSALVHDGRLFTYGNN